MQVQTFLYEGNPIAFDVGSGSSMINATQMSKPFKKLPKNWLVNKSTKSFLNELSTVRGILLTDLVTIKQGGTNQGTWFHEDVALEFARWLSPKFAIWCNDRIKELLTTGSVSINQPPIPTKLELAEQLVTLLKQQAVNAPKVLYVDEVLQSKSTYTTTEMAKDLGFRSATALNKALQERGVLFQSKGSRQWLLTADYSELGYTKTRTHKRETRNGEIITTIYTVWTEKGRQFLHHLFTNLFNFLT